MQSHPRARTRACVEKQNDEPDSIEPMLRPEHGRSSKGLSKFLGVSWRAREKRWAAQVVLQGRPVFIGSFASEWDAGVAYARTMRMLKVMCPDTQMDMHAIHVRQTGKNWVFWKLPGFTGLGPGGSGFQSFATQVGSSLA